MSLCSSKRTNVTLIGESRHFAKCVAPSVLFHSPYPMFVRKVWAPLRTATCISLDRSSDMTISPLKQRAPHRFAEKTKKIWKSTDGATTFSKSVGFPPIKRHVVLFDEHRRTIWSSTPTVYVGVNVATGPNLYESSDGGVNWSPVPGQPITSNQER